MRKILIILGVSVVCLTSVAVRSDEGQRGMTDEQTIRKAISAYAGAFNKADLDGLMSIWAADAEYIDEKGAVTKGRPAIKESFKSQLSKLKGAKVAFKVTSIRQLTPDVILQDGASKLTLPDGTIDQGRFAAVWSRKDGKWLMHSVRDLPAEAGAAAAAGGPLKELQWMIGDWRAEKEGVEVSVRWTLNQTFLSQDYTVKRGDTSMEVKQLVGFDPLSGQIKSWTFDSLGGYGEGLWTRDGNSWVIQTAGVLPGGQTGTALNLIRHEDNEHAVFQVKRREVDGQPIADSEVRLVRQVPSK
jgi:uncharacterized protein (TIGR02246 family)